VSPYDRSIWVAPLSQGKETVFFRQVVYVDDPGKVVSKAWREHGYVQDCERKRIRRGSVPASYERLRLYHVRHSRMLDESTALQDQDVREGDVFVLTELGEDATLALARTHGVPESINPKDYPYGDKVSIG
jgi:hypothetical protein